MYIDIHMIGKMLVSRFIDLRGRWNTIKTVCKVEFHLVTEWEQKFVLH